MNDYKLISWIYLATALASQNTPTNLEGISMIADGINHAVPTQKEMRLALKWLSAKNLVLKTGNKYSLTEKGKSILLSAEEKSNILLQIRADLEITLHDI